MMTCPRCGFVQPADRYCASCGLDVSHFQHKQKPMILRFLQNPNLHLTLIAALVIFTLGYIFYSQRDLLGKEVGNLLGDIPLLSRESSTVTAESVTEPNPAPTNPIKTVSTEPEVAESVAEDAASKDETPAPPSEAVGDLEISFWEVPKDALTTVLSTADKTNDSGEGQILVWAQRTKIASAVEGNGQKLEGGKPVSLTSSPVTISEGIDGAPLQFSMNVTVTKSQGSELNVKFAIDWHMPLQEVGRSVDSSIDGVALMPYKGAVAVIMDPAEQSVRPELAKNASGPLAIFKSEEFKQGLTDWVILIRAKE